MSGKKKIATILAAMSAPGWILAGVPDVPREHWASDAVEKVAQSGIMTATSDGKFHGDKPATRYDVALSLARVMAEVENQWSARGQNPEDLVPYIERINLYVADEIDKLKQEQREIRAWVNEILAKIDRGEIGTRGSISSSSTSSEVPQAPAVPYCAPDGHKKGAGKAHTEHMRSASMPWQQPWADSSRPLQTAQAPRAPVAPSTPSTVVHKSKKKSGGWMYRLFGIGGPEEEATHAPSIASVSASTESSQMAAQVVGTATHAGKAPAKKSEPARNIKGLMPDPILDGDGPDVAPAKPAVTHKPVEAPRIQAKAPATPPAHLETQLGQSTRPAGSTYHNLSEKSLALLEEMRARRK